LIEIDESEFPVVILRASGHITADDWAHLGEVLGKHFDAQQKFALALHTADLKIPEVRLLKQIGAWRKDRKDEVDRYVVRAALCIPSPMARGALKFIHGISQSRMNQAVFADWEETLAWAREAFAEGTASQG
jgi:hypothetical protein